MSLFSIKSILYCYLSITSLVGLAKEKHPFHVSTTEINLNTKEKTLEISCHIFTDDFEDALAKNYKTKTDLLNQALHKQMDVLVKKYVLTHLQLKANNKSLTLNYIGFEQDHEVINVYLEANDIAVLKKLETTNTILHDSFDDQIQIIHVFDGKQRKSSKLTYPDKQLVTLF